MAEVLQSLAETAANILETCTDAQMFVGSACLLFAFFCGTSLLLPLVTPSSGRVRRQAWIITFASSVVMSLTGLYFGVQLWDNKDSLLGEDGLSDIDAVLARGISIFFLAYCLVDSLTCWFFYHEVAHITYTHHAVYFCLITYLIQSDQSILFALCAGEEFPTLCLSIYMLLGDFRPRLSTGIAILATRVTYHLYMTYAAAQKLNSMLFVFSLLLLIQHIKWFRSWFIKRMNEVRGQPYSPNDESSAKKNQRSLSLEVTTHVYLITALLVLQTVMHATLMVLEIRTAILPQANWNERNWQLAGLIFSMVFHVSIFMFITVLMVSIIQDVYTEHFIMHAISKKEIIYNISWEDPREEREALGITGDDVILTISSAGCNVLDYLIEGPKAIVACDFNVAQLAVLELKLACIKHLDFERFFQIWAQSNFTVFQESYKSILRPTLTDNCRDFWDENEALIRDNFMFAGTSGLAAKMLRPALLMCGMMENMVKRKLYLPASIGITIVRQILNSQTLWGWLAPLGGVPKSQLDLVKREPWVWSDRLEEVVGRRMWNADNYFYYAYIAGEWSKECCPRYMEEKNFASLQKYADRVTLHHGPIAEAAQLRDDFTFASLLDSMDWMPDTMIADQLAKLIPRMRPAPAGHIFWRSFATKVHSPVLASLEPELLPDINGRERVGWYLSQWIADVPSNVDYSMLLNEGSKSMPVNTLMDDVNVMAAMAMHGLRSEKDVKAFYKSQGSNYDGFREALLPDRDLLLKYCVPWHKKPKTWVSVGCGTARDIEYVVGHVKACGTKVYLVDLSPDLLDMAKTRVEKLGLSDLVTCVEADIITAYDRSTGKPKEGLDLPPLGIVDLVTCSYCLTMIPPWKEALNAMIEMVKEGGTLALVDFTRRSDAPSSFSQRLNTWWFAHDGVYFNLDHTEFLRSRPDFTTTWFAEAEDWVPYVPLQATHYTWAGKKVSVQPKPKMQIFPAGAVAPAAPEAPEAPAVPAVPAASTAASSK
eukprot:CAMPEP_0185769046 /NCGR_PEP_ID=MMETSP1174-20130828/53332_1 /TAXON_ID=35687 /ORGANISM="Dictyocha speculum, Strain CCMP1381" /LENGTH=993 /DNA_ID=CAMNT_0028453987 /DNA_START=26 /DNA_END=3007 /DNA_ORIENTATION=+